MQNLLHLSFLNYREALQPEGTHTSVTLAITTAPNFKPVMLNIRRKQLGIRLLFYFKEFEGFVPLSKHKTAEILHTWGKAEVRRW